MFDENKMTANTVFTDTVQYLSKYNREDLVEIAYSEYDIKVDPSATKDEIVNECALAEVNCFSH